jgi:hypothetical protein
MTKRFLKTQIKHAEKELKNSYKILKRSYGMENPKDWLDDNCGSSLEAELSYASYQRGKLQVLEQWEFNCR